MQIMNKKDLKMYEATACEVMEMEASVALLAGSTASSNADGIGYEEPEQGADPE